eukprot:TRINITY_DN1776_c0_g1::TRINITY_DN1776_c0_g1_i2::g.25046::m.25046 TRINITY_DN1776_c0_g1::TRINITY_DN1776_c0_g1_i2::g.25046  ORF type:complete len:246 (-),score=22.76,sp/Q4R871/CCYL2_MACFA/25.23/6e-07,Cyclin/PF08613.6/3.5e-13,Cyclin_N/PF00134.18/2.5e-08,Cyclin_N/PF00134.18/6e+03,FPN1/PF06963.7/0.038,SCF/PF02404.10/0.17 TRINITY_DN1776_c0_g1_i2:312-1049(-)
MKIKGGQFYPSIVEDTSLCAVYAAAFLNELTDYNYPELSQQDLRRFGLLNDPVNLMIEPWTEYLIQFVTRQEVTLALLYIKRLVQMQDCLLTRYNRHRVFFVALMMANKYMDDIAYVNSQWADISKCWTKKQLSKYEREFLRLLDWRLHIHQEEYTQFYQMINHICRTSKLMEIQEQYLDQTGPQRTKDTRTKSTQAKESREKLLPPVQGSPYRKTSAGLYGQLEMSKERRLKCLRNSTDPYRSL